MTKLHGLTVSDLQSGAIPHMVHPESNGVRLSDWLASNKSFIDQQLARYGALLLRGFSISDEAEFPAIVSRLCDHALSYVYRSTPRTQVGDKIYTATEYPAHKSIPFHNEEAYTLDWPMRLIFYCALPADEGGETPIADTVKVTSHIPPNIIEEFSRRKVMYVRNYGMGVDLDWQTVFQSQERSEVEQYCQAHQIEYEWKPNNCLRTRQICQATALHPETGQVIWFNQTHLFHVSSLDEKTRASMQKIYKENDLPRNAYFGDGSPISETMLDQIRASYEKERIEFTWHADDVMLLDNMLVSHARNPYKGKRRVLVGMGNAYSEVSEGRSSRASVTR